MYPIQNYSLKGDKATLAFEHVNYRYQHAENLALEDIDFSAKSGETVAIIGGTGSGKTTLVNLYHVFMMLNLARFC